MLNDKSGQLMLISAFMLAMVVVVISLMLNNVIYAGNLAYVGFMDQTRYDDLNFKQTTASEMNYAYNQYTAPGPHPPGTYGQYLQAYENTINSITNIKGRYVELDLVTEPNSHQLTYPRNDQHSLSIFGKSSSATYVINTGTNTVPTYDIVLQQPVPTTITNNGIDKASLTATVTYKSGGAVPAGIFVKFWSSSNNGKFTVGGVSDPNGWPTNNLGKVTVDYSDTGLASMINIIAYIDSDQSHPEGISLTSAGHPIYIIDVGPHTTPISPLSFISTTADLHYLPLTVTVTDVHGYPLSGVTLQFHTSRATSSITDAPYGHTGNLVTDPSGTVTVYYHDTGENVPGMCDFYVTDADGLNPSNHVQINCQPPNMYNNNPVIVNANLVPDKHANTYTITIPFDFNPLVGCNIDQNSNPVSSSTDVTITSIYFSQTGTSTGNLVIVASIPAPVNPTFTITCNAKFTATCNDPNYNPNYSKDGIVTVTGNKDSVVAAVTYP